jgi:predicted amidophosphoribosyltransferase
VMHEYQAKSAKRAGCGHIFLKNEVHERYCGSCSRKLRHHQIAVCGRCFKEFERKVARQRLCAARVVDRQLGMDDGP